jgi:photosystem II stability/assembly factor-like uncharacterized protein
MQTGKTLQPILICLYGISCGRGTVYTASSGGVHKSTDGTATWHAINDGLIGPQALSGYQVILFNNALYVATADGIYKSTNGGTNWIKKTSGIVVGGGALYAFCKSIFANNGVLYSGSYTGIYRSTNLGKIVSININELIGVGYFINPAERCLQQEKALIFRQL